MKARFFLTCASALLLAAVTIDVQAAPGDVYVPAHRTRDGSFVPANVPPSSGGSRVARKLGRSPGGVRTVRTARNGIVMPIFVAAKTVSR